MHRQRAVASSVPYWQNPCKYGCWTECFPGLAMSRSWLISQIPVFCLLTVDFNLFLVYKIAPQVYQQFLQFSVPLNWGLVWGCQWRWLVYDTSANILRSAGLARTAEGDAEFCKSQRSRCVWSEWILFSDAGLFLSRQDEYVKHTLKLSFWVVKRMIF